MKHFRILRLNSPSLSLTLLTLTLTAISVGFFPAVSNGLTCYSCFYTKSSFYPRQDSPQNDNCYNPANGKVDTVECAGDSSFCSTKESIFIDKTDPFAARVELYQRLCSLFEFDPKDLTCLTKGSKSARKRRATENRGPGDFKYFDPVYSKECPCAGNNCNGDQYQYFPPATPTNTTLKTQVGTGTNANGPNDGTEKSAGLSLRDKKLDYTYLLLIFASIWIWV